MPVDGAKLQVVNMFLKDQEPISDLEFTFQIKKLNSVIFNTHLTFSSLPEGFLKKRKRLQET